MKRELPTVILEGTEFIVDVKKLQLREKADPRNIISFTDMDDVGCGYSFECRVKNSHSFSEFKMPEWVMLDPIGMAKKHGLTLMELAGKTDYEVMVDQKALDLRVKKGQLPTVKIAGHLFYVDARMDKLRPKDEFLSKGIKFTKIDHYFVEERNSYMIPYNPKTFEFQELSDNITEFPKDLIAVEFPVLKTLDPVGWNRLHGWDLEKILKENGIRSHFNAKTIPWEKTSLPYLIADNLKRQREAGKEKKERISRKKGKGPRM